jgi:hypothetical protein
MEGRLMESLTAITQVHLNKLTKNGGELLYSDIGKNTGLEIEGNIPNTLTI